MEFPSLGISAKDQMTNLVKKQLVRNGRRHSLMSGHLVQ
jgi:hypothetical protein